MSVTTKGLVRVAIATHVHRDHVIAQAGELLHLVLPNEPTVWEAMDEQHQLTRWIARFHVVQSNLLHWTKARIKKGFHANSEHLT